MDALLGNQYVLIGAIVVVVALVVAAYFYFRKGSSQKSSEDEEEFVGRGEHLDNSDETEEGYEDEAEGEQEVAKED